MVANLKDDLHKRHFKHKNKTECCNETYLHNLAKRRLAEHFLKSEHFNIIFEVADSCPRHKQCKYAIPSCVNRREFKIVDLKKYYQHCELEKQITRKDNNRYIADICLISDKTNVPPMFLEILVSHECTDEKKNSGIKILEIPIHSEDDIDKCCNTNSYKENGDLGVKFYNIKRKNDTEIINREILRYIHIPTKGSEIVRVSCRDVSTVLSQESDIELNVLRKEQTGCPFYPQNDLVEAIEFRHDVGANSKDKISHCEECTHYNPFKGPIETDNHLCAINFFRTRPEGLCSDFTKKKGCKQREILILSQIELEYVKGTEPIAYFLAIIGPMEFSNYRLIEDVCNDRLAEISRHNIVLCAQSMVGKRKFAKSVSDYTEDYDLRFENFFVNRSKYGEFAGSKSNDEVLDVANELIVFYNPNDKLTQDIIQKAQNKKIPIKLVDLEQITRVRNICPQCGGVLVRRIGKRGSFLGCSGYPECNYTM